MKTSAAYTLLFATLAQLTNVAYCGDADPAHPAKALYAESQALRELVKAGNRPAYKAEFAPAIKACREKLLAYTKTHHGGDLDGLNWGNTYRSIYLSSACREWKTYRESEANVREAWEILGKAKPDDPHKTTDLCIEIAQWHIACWSTIDPEPCSAFMDEVTRRLLPKASPDATRGWNFFASGFEEGFIEGAETLPPARRAAVLQRADNALLARLQDESISVNVRSDALGSYANQLYGQGEADRAAALLDPWWTKHGEKIEAPLFYSARFHIACYGTGDWAKACETLRQMDKLVKAGVISADEDLYKLMVANYHKNVEYPEAELKRRAAVFNAERKKARKEAGQ